MRYKTNITTCILIKSYDGHSEFFCIICCLNRIAKDPRFERLPCTHKGTYADDCIVERVTQVILKYLQITVESHERCNKLSKSVFRFIKPYKLLFKTAQVLYGSDM